MTAPTMPAEQPESVVVPREPTPEMIRAMCVAIEDAEFMDPEHPDWRDGYDAWIYAAKAAYQSLLATAPRQPQGAEVVAYDNDVLDTMTGASSQELTREPYVAKRFERVRSVQPLYTTPQPVQPAPVGRDVFVPLSREPLAAIASLDGEVKEPLVCLTIPERDAILAALSQPAPEAGEVLPVHVVRVENATTDREDTRHAVRSSDLYRRGDTVQVWINEADLYGHPAVAVEIVDALSPVAGGGEK